MMTICDTHLVMSSAKSQSGTSPIKEYAPFYDDIKDKGKMNRIYRDVRTKEYLAMKYINFLESIKVTMCFTSIFRQPQSSFLLFSHASTVQHINYVLNTPFPSSLVCLGKTNVQIIIVIFFAF